MAMTKEIQEDAELAKSQIISSSMDDECKKSLLRLVNTSTLATNGISTEEKIQKITEAIQGLVITQIMFLNSVDRKIEAANKKQCEDCKALKHADEVDKQKAEQEIIDRWKKAAGYKDEDHKKVAGPLDLAKQILVKPWIWIFSSLLVFSPYGIEIIHAVGAMFGK